MFTFQNLSLSFTDKQNQVKVADIVCDFVFGQKDAQGNRNNSTSHRWLEIKDRPCGGWLLIDRFDYIFQEFPKDETFEKDNSFPLFGNCLDITQENFPTGESLEYLRLLLKSHFGLSMVFACSRKVSFLQQTYKDILPNYLACQTRDRLLGNPTTPLEGKRGFYVFVDSMLNLAHLANEHDLITKRQKFFPDINWKGGFTTTEKDIIYRDVIPRAAADAVDELKNIRWGCTAPARR
jgi:hypothetical protein